MLLVGLTLTTIFGMNGKGYGSAKDINLGLDLAGGVSITYEIQEDNPTSQDIEDTTISLRNVLKEEVPNPRYTRKAIRELQLKFLVLQMLMKFLQN